LVAKFEKQEAISVVVAMDFQQLLKFNFRENSILFDWAVRKSELAIFVDESSLEQETSCFVWIAFQAIKESVDLGFG
jgi:hypothetical protein